MKKKQIFILLSLIICMLLAGCSSQTQNPPAGTSASPEGQTETASPAAKAAEQIKTQPPEQEDACNVCFIGNSLIEYGAQALFLKDFAAAYGTPIHVDQLTWGGSFLSDYVKGTHMPKKEVKNRLKKADIVVFQDYGGWQGRETVQAIKKLQKWCKKDAGFYYYMYDEDDAEMNASDYKRFRKMKLEFIPKGQTIDALYDMGYTYEDLHLEGDFHPNIFNGYVAALVMHSVIFKEKCVDFPQEWFSGEETNQWTGPFDKVTEFIQGESIQEKWEEFQKICEKADKLTQQAGDLGR